VHTPRSNSLKKLLFRSSPSWVPRKIESLYFNGLPYSLHAMDHERVHSKVAEIAEVFTRVQRGARGSSDHPPARFGSKSETALFVLVGYRFAQSSLRTLRFELWLRELGAESLSVERHGARARNDFDVFELQRLALR
jgi:hypothetical protein